MYNLIDFLIFLMIAYLIRGMSYRARPIRHNLSDHWVCMPGRFVLQADRGLWGSCALTNFPASNLLLSPVLHHTSFHIYFSGTTAQCMLVPTPFLYRWDPHNEKNMVKWNKQQSHCQTGCLCIIITDDL